MKIKTLDLLENKRIRVNKAGCLGRCDSGPVMVVYPQGIWYAVLDETDVDEIIQSHILEGKVVERLMLIDEKLF